MFGGPVYFYQNLVYNTPTGSLKYIEGSAGILTYNNTIIGEGRAGPASNETFRNNLILAQGAMEPVFAITTYTNYTTSDYNGFRPNPASRTRSNGTPRPSERPRTTRRLPSSAISKR